MNDQPNDVNPSEDDAIDAASPIEMDEVKIEDVDIEEDVVAAERDTYRESLQRLQADFENYRKRVLKQQAETSERANEALVQKLLPVLDTIDLAKAHEPSGSLEQIAVSMLDVLTKEGLERIEAQGQPFDPTLHEAVAHEPGEGDPTVGEELRAGYRWRGRVVRPAMVKVVG